MKLSLLKLTGFLILASSFLLSAFADSATWNLDPNNGKWSRDENWAPASAPHGASDVATFGVSDITHIRLPFAQPWWEISGIDFSPGASAYTLEIQLGHGPGLTLRMTGVGVINNSGITQTFVTERKATAFGSISFGGNATGGTNVYYDNKGSVAFDDDTTAGNAT